MERLEITTFIIIGFLGIILAIFGLVKVFSRRITESRRELHEKVDRLEKEIEKLKNRK